MAREVIIADNQDITRQGLLSVLTGMPHCAGTVHICRDRQDLAATLSKIPRAVVILDYTLFDFYGSEQMLNLASRYDRSSWLLFSDELGKAFLRTVFVGDQFGVVMKGDPLAEIAAAIKETLGYISYRCETAVKILEERQADPAGEKLTLSEISVLREIALGRTTKEIAAGRSLSFHTVNSHRKNIFRKLGVNNVQEAIRYALRAGVIDMADYSI